MYDVARLDIKRILSVYGYFSGNFHFQVKEMSTNEVCCNNANEGFLEAVYNGETKLKVSPHETTCEKNYAPFYTILMQKFSLLSQFVKLQLGGLWCLFFDGNDFYFKVILSISLINII